MKTVAIIGQKGGTGKSTLATCLAVVASEVGETVVIIDLDQQGSAIGWQEARSDSENPVVAGTTVSRLRQTWEAAAANRADLCIIDTPGKATDIAIEAARLADLILVPIQPTKFAMDNLPTDRATIRAAGDPPAFVVYNQMPPTGFRVAEEFKALTAAFCDIAACPVHLTKRASYAEAPSSGLTAPEVDSDPKARDEIERLYLFVKEQLKKGQKHGKARTA